MNQSSQHLLTLALGMSIAGVAFSGSAMANTPENNTLFQLTEHQAPLLMACKDTSNSGSTSSTGSTADHKCGSGSCSGKDSDKKCGSSSCNSKTDTTQSGSPASTTTPDTSTPADNIPAQ